MVEKVGFWGTTGLPGELGYRVDGEVLVVGIEELNGYFG